MNRTTLAARRRMRVTYSVAPAAPDQPTATSLTANGVHLSVPPVATADTYKYQQTLSGGTVWTDIYTGTDPFVDVAGLTAATAYDFRVAAYDGTAPSLWSPIRTVTTLGSAAPPASPAQPTASNITDTTATLTIPAVTGATSYPWEWSANGTTGWTADSSSTTTTLNATGMSPSTSRWFRVSATNADGTSAPSPTRQVTTTATAGTPPAKPAAPTFASATTTSITMALAANATSTAELVEKALTTGTPSWTTAYTGPPVGTVTASGLTAATGYQFRRTSSNAAGPSPVSDIFTWTTPTSTANVQPVSGLSVVSRAGVCAHPNFNGALEVWKSSNADAFVSRVASMGMSFIRGSLPAQAVSDVWATACRTYGIKWLMTVIPEGATSPTTQTVAETRAEVARIEANYADICAGIEGLNEPNHNRGGGTVPLDWAHTTFLHQQAIWQTAKLGGSAIAGVTIVGPSLHDVAADNSYSQASPSGGKFHFEQLRDEGILAYQDMSGLHTYPGGSFPLRQLDSRLAHIYGAYGNNYPVWCTEHGWHNALGMGPGGHRPASEAVAATYAPRGILQFLTTVKPDGLARDLRYTYFEGVDDYDGAPPFTNQESHFGLIGVSTTSATAAVNPSLWRSKPIVGTISALLNALADPPGTAPYTPPMVVCNVSTAATGAALQWQVLANKARADAGRALWVGWRDKDVWNRDTSTNITVPPVTVNITDRVGAQTPVSVDGNVTLVELR